MEQVVAVTSEVKTPNVAEVGNFNNDRTVAFMNEEVVGPKATSIMKRAIMADYQKEGHGIWLVGFRTDGYPKGEGSEEDIVSWVWYPNPKAAICNLIGCIEIAFMDTMDDTCENTCFVGVHAAVWKNLIQGFLHESHHANAFLQDADKLFASADERKKEELRAEAFSREMLKSLAKDFDIEPEFPEGMAGIIDETLREEIAKVRATANPTEHMRLWADTQEYLIQNGGMFYKPGTDGKTPVYIRTFREWLHFMSGDDQNNAEWTKTVECLLVQERVVTQPVAEVEPFVGGYTAAVASAEDTPTSAFYQPPAVTPGMQGVPAQYVQPTPTYTQVTPDKVVAMGAGAYPPINMAPEHAQQVINGLYLKMANHMFNVCQFNPANPKKPFMLSERINLPFVLTPEEKMFVKEMNTEAQAGVEVGWEVVGKFIDNAKLLPSYEVTLSLIDGTQVRRSCFPQNPNKVTNGAYTKTAVLAQQGNRIMWIMDSLTKEFKSIRVFNGVIQTNVGNRWV